MSGGYIKLHRKVWSHPLFGEEPFTRREAWIWILSNAAFKPRTVTFGGKTHNAARGEVVATASYLAKAWRWQKPKVQRFLRALAGEGMVEIETGRDATRVRVLNYERFQGDQNANIGLDPDPTGDPTRDPRGDPRNDPATDPTSDPRNPEQNCEKLGGADPATDPATDPARDPGCDPTGDPTRDPNLRMLGKKVGKKDSLSAAGAAGELETSHPPAGPDPVDLAFDRFRHVAGDLGLPVPKKLTDARRRKLRARLKGGGLETWEAALERLAASPFLRGEKTDFRADLDFMLQESSFNRLLEGRYDPSPNEGRSAPKSDVRSYVERRIAELS